MCRKRVKLPCAQSQTQDKEEQEKKMVKTREIERGGFEENKRSKTEVVKRPEEEDKKTISETNKLS